MCRRGPMSAFALNRLPEPMKCRACRSTALTWLCPVRDAPREAAYHRCDHCGSFNSSLDYDDVKPLYGAEHIRHALVDFGSYDRLERIFLGHLAMIVTGPPHEKSCLDIGCLDGAFLGLISRHGYEVHGFDVEPAVQPLVSRHVGCPPERIRIADDFRAALFPQVGVVHCSEVIEHVEDPAALLREIHDVLLPGGVLMLQTPRPIADLSGGWNQAPHLCIIQTGQLARLARAARLQRLARYDCIWNVGQLLLFRKPGGLPDASARGAVHQVMASINRQWFSVTHRGRLFKTFCPRCRHSRRAA